jgi:hypothetical protein
MAATFALGCLCSSGCSKSTPTGTVSGTVTFEGQPVDEGVVAFTNLKTGAGANAKLEAGGKFSLEKPLDVGTYRVVITPPTIDDLPGGAGDPSKMPKPKTYPNIPRGYRSQESTDLEVTVKEGENNFPLQMKKGGGKKQGGPSKKAAP